MMSFFQKLCVFLVSLIGGFSFIPHVIAQQVNFKPRDKIAFVGNSITFNGGFFHNIALFYATRYPDLPIQFFNAGIGGNMAEHVLSRLDSDVFIIKPNWIILKLGMNDVNKSLYSPGSDNIINIKNKRNDALLKFQIDYKTIVQRSLARNIHVILQTPTIYDQMVVMTDTPYTGRNDALKSCAKFVMDLADSLGIPCIDYWTIMDSITRNIQKTNPRETIIGKDRVHPGPIGHFIMGYEFIKTLRLEPYVSSVTIKIANGKIVRNVSINCYLTEISIKRNNIRFSILGKSLPFPVPAESEGALTLVPFKDQFNQERLTILGLRKGQYELTIGESKIGEYSDKELSTGIELSSNRNTPQYKQSQNVLSMFRSYWKLESQVRWIRAIEFSRLRPIGIVDIGKAANFFNNSLAKLQDSTTKTFRDLVEMKNRYLYEKVREKELYNEMSNIYNAIYKINRPFKFEYNLRRIY